MDKSKPELVAFLLRYVSPNVPTGDLYRRHVEQLSMLLGAATSYIESCSRRTDHALRRTT